MNSRIIKEIAQNISESEEPAVKIFDGICGSGKTTLISKLIKGTSDSQKIIFITPYLSECHRLAGTRYKLDDEGKVIPLKNADGTFVYESESFYADFSKSFVHPEDEQTSEFRTKQQSLKHLINTDRNIVCSHATFLNLQKSTIELIKEKNYHLIIDETINLIESFKVDSDSMNFYIENGFIKIGANKKLVWQKKTEYSNISQFKNERIAIKNGKIYNVSQDSYIKIIPIETFLCFKNISVFTYLYYGTTLSYYFELFEIYPDIEELEYHQNSGESLFKKYSDLITVENKSKFNSIGNEDYSLSSKWYKNYKNKNKLKSIKKLYAGFFRQFNNNAKVSMWTCFKLKKEIVQYQGHSKNFVPFNAKAFNYLKDMENLAYLVNVFMDPNLYNFLNKKDVDCNLNLYALSEMIQWIFRSRIREGHPINIYVPSKRMRKLLEAWINYEDMKHYVAMNPSEFPGLKIKQINLELNGNNPHLFLYFYKEDYNDEIENSEAKLNEKFPLIKSTIYVLDRNA